MNGRQGTDDFHFDALFQLQCQLTRSHQQQQISLIHQPSCQTINDEVLQPRINTTTSLCIILVHSTGTSSTASAPWSCFQCGTWQSSSINRAIWWFGKARGSSRRYQTRSGSFLRPPEIQDVTIAQVSFAASINNGVAEKMVQAWMHWRMLRFALSGYSRREAYEEICIATSYKHVKIRSCILATPTNCLIIRR